MSAACSARGGMNNAVDRVHCFGCLSEPLCGGTVMSPLLNNCGALEPECTPSSALPAVPWPRQLVGVSAYLNAPIMG
jgi:hypothetical protein